MPLNHRDFWDTKHLKLELATGAMSEGKAFLYFFAIMGFDWLQFTTFRLSPASVPISAWERVDAWLTFALTVFGLAFLFWCNGGVRGKDFLYRYFPLSFVVGWKFMVSAFATLWLCDLALQNVPASTAGWVSTAILAFFNVAMILRIGLHMKELSHSMKFSFPKPA